jgi:glutamate synthase domain-containing protein 3
MVDVESVWQDEDVRSLRNMIESHFRYTGSPRAAQILENWESRLPLFVKIMPIEYRKSLERMRLEEELNAESVSATEEVFRG